MRRSEVFRIVHLSDIHLAKECIGDFDNFVIKALKCDLKRFHDTRKIDLVVLSGDLIDKGGRGFDNIDAAFKVFTEKVIDPISDTIDLSYDQIFLIPGNHDINREADDEIDEAGLCSVLNSTEKVNKIIDSKTDKGIKRILHYKEFESEFYKDFKGDHKLTKYQSCFKLKVNDTLIGITCFNSAWRCHDSDTDKGKIILGEKQIIDARKIIEGCDLKVGIIHHAFDWLADFESKDVQALIQKDYNILFCGHIHEGSAWSKTNLYGSIFVSVAPANWSYNIREPNRTNGNGYTIVDYDMSNCKVIVHNRRYSYHKECYDPNVDLGDEKGLFVIELPSSKEIAKRSQVTQIVSNIKNSTFDMLNEHLITYDTDTKAPKILDDLFVMPRIVEKLHYDVEDKEIIHTLKDLCTYKGNILLLGPKESGKTILLDVILKELANNIHKYRVTPVLFNFNEVGNRRYKTIISSFLGISIHDVQDYLLNNKIVLLIDDISFDEMDKYRLKKLESLIKDYPKIKILATCSQTTEGNIPSLELLKVEMFYTFKVLHIDSFKTQQIRELILKWFANRDTNDITEKAEKLLNFVLSVNLPRTPLAISMLLWIIEKQENYKPINNATMLENFIERLFKKTAKHEIYSHEFDYRNKERLLADIAHKMYRDGLENYRLRYQDILNFIDNYLKVRKFEFEAEKVLKHFLSKGIIIKESDEIERYARFRFACFFQYFLTKKIEFDSDFRDHVLDERNTLKFLNEIDYYTGIKRDQLGILQMLVGRMNDEFSDLIDLISQEEKSYDTIFSTQTAIIETLDESFTKKISAECKPQQNELDDITDKMLDEVKPEKGIARKKDDLTPIQRLERLWTLTARVLRNTEEIDIKDVKYDSYTAILKCSMAYACLYKVCLEDYIKQHKDAPKFKLNTNLQLTRSFIPLIHQLWIYVMMGTSKLNMVIREKINNDAKNGAITDFEKFLSVFIYVDIKGKNYEKFLKAFVKEIKSKYMYDMTLFKILAYYFLRSKTKGTDDFYLNQIAELIVSVKGIKKEHKGKIMTTYKRKKKQKQKELGSDLDE